MNKGQERRSEFVVSGGNASELLEATEEALDQISIPIKMPVVGAWGTTIGARRDTRLSALRLDDRHQGIGVVALVSHNEASRLIADQRGGLIDVRDLSRRKNDAQRIAQCVDGNMQFGRQPAFRPADFLTTGFF